jgi:hypothetical protein
MRQPGARTSHPETRVELPNFHPSEATCAAPINTPRRVKYTWRKKKDPRVHPCLLVEWENTN